tara:strand:+ start:1349 stop:1657 length:309 start_codon:yes stop_codon:yes gene_type:complete
LKKVLILTVFLGGGIYLISKLLPKFTSKPENLDLEAEDFEVTLVKDRKGGGGGGSYIRQIRDESPITSGGKLGDINDPSWLYGQTGGYQSQKELVQAGNMAF